MTILSLTSSFNYNKILGKLYQGSYPPVQTAKELKEKGFDYIVFCARELQPSNIPYNDEGINVVYAPNDDVSQISVEQLQTALKTAEFVAKLIRDGKKVLVTCAMGHNRSGLVTALSLCHLTDFSAGRIISLIKNSRLGAMRNKYFCDILEKARERIKYEPYRKLPESTNLTD